MKARKPRKDEDVDMADAAEPKPKPRPKRAKKSSPRPKEDKAARFKEEQHLKVETQDLEEAEKKEEEDKAAPPSSSSKKRRRRSAAEIDRKFRCPFPDCPKAYGTEGSLIQHQRLKHPDQTPEPAETQGKTVGNFVMPHSASRTVTIRPATPLVGIASAPSLGLGSQDDAGSSSEMGPPSAKSQRCNARLRSNSLPVTSAMEDAPAVRATPKPSNASALHTRTKTARKPRRVPTPHPKKAVATARRAKLRSKSESMPEMGVFQPPLDELKMPASHRSDSTASSHEPIMPISSTMEGQSSFITTATEHHPTSVSSDDQAIDSDILSVLANCDAEEVGDPTVIDFGGGPPSYQSSASFGEKEDAEMLPVGMECFKIAEHSTLPSEAPGFAMREPEAELGLSAFATIGDDWINALHLTKNLEKMSVTQADPPSHNLDGSFSRPPVTGRLRSASDPSFGAASLFSGLSHLSSMPASFSAKSDEFHSRVGQETGETALDSQQAPPTAGFPPWIGALALSDPAKTDHSSLQQGFWTSSEAGVATASTTQPSSQVLDDLLQHDDPLEWKASAFEGDADADYGLEDVAMTSALL